MSELFNFIELIGKYKEAKAKAEYDNEDESTTYPSPALKELWMLEGELKTSFRKSILETLSSR